MSPRVLIACLLFPVTCHLFFSFPAAHADGRLELLDGSPPARLYRPTTFRSIAGWRALIDTDTGVPLRLYGGGLPVRGRPASFARAILDRDIGLLAPGARASDFHLTADHASRGVRTVTFTHRAIIGGQISFRFVRDRLVAIASEAVPQHGPLPGATVLPIVRRGSVELRAVRAVRRGPHRVFLDAATGAPIARQSLWHSGQGTLRYDTPVRYPEGGRAAFAAAHASVLVDDSPATTDAAGVLTWPTDAAASVDAAATGLHVSVHNEAGDDATAALVLAPDGAVTWSDATPEIDAQITAYVHANLGKDALRLLAPELAWLDEQLDVHVNDSLGTCNAYSDGNALHFFGESEACHNAARLPDIVYHELGHSFHANVLIPGAGAFESALSEGTSDYLAASITGDPAVGIGFWRSAAPLRHIDPDDHEARWPDDVSFDDHTTGLIVSGALWDLRTELMADLGEEEGAALADQLYLAVLLRASDIPSSYVEVMVADDDDGDLENGTPHGCAIQTAFGRHGLADPATVGVIGRPITSGLRIDVEVRAPDLPCDALEVASMRVLWHRREEPEVGGAIDMESTVTGYTATLPDQPEHTALGYQIEVTMADGTVALRPANPADPVYQLFHGETTALYCTGLETSPWDDGWERGTQAGRDMGDWAWGTPLGERGSGDPSGAYTGDGALGTDLGQLAADGRYDPDVVSYVDMPDVEVPPGASVRLQYRRWLTVEDASYDQATISSNGAPVWTNADGGAGQLHHRDTEWRFHDVDLTGGIFDDRVAVRFELASDGDVELGGWNIDDVCVVAFGGDGEGGGDAGPRPFPDDGGCGCRAGAQPGSTAALLLLGALGQIRRRRRRRVSRERAREQPQHRHRSPAEPDHDAGVDDPAPRL